MTRNATKPTYEVVGPPQRFDERDSLFARERLVPGSPLERIYHTMYPDRERIDRRLASFIEQVDDPQGSSQLDGALYRATFGPVAGLALPDIVDGAVAKHRVHVSAAAAAQRMKTLALHLGADEVRIGPLNPAWVYSHRGTPPLFESHTANPPHFCGVPEGYSGLRWGDPIDLPHTTAVSMAFGQNLRLLRTGGTPFSDFEIGRVYALSALVASQIASYIRALGWSARAHHLRHYDVVLVPVAIDAGLGDLGRCGYLVNSRFGANLRLACVTTDMPLAIDGPVDIGIQDFCSKCRKCATNCPARAIPHGEREVVRGVRKWRVDAHSCLLYWGHLGSACAICQTVCPWSKPRTLPHRLIAQLAARAPAARRFLVWADDLLYGRAFRPAPPPRWAA